MSKSPNNKRKYNNSDVTTIALCQLGGALRYVHLEDVAMKAAQLSPKAFSWKKYPEQVNLETVRLALKNELEANNRRVHGSIRDGWMLTPEGLSWCLADASAGPNHFSTEQICKEIARAKKTEAFSKTATNRVEEVSDTDMKAFLRIDEYFSTRNRRERVAAITNAAALDPQLRIVLTTLKQRRFSEFEVDK